MEHPEKLSLNFPNLSKLIGQPWSSWTTYLDESYRNKSSVSVNNITKYLKEDIDSNKSLKTEMGSQDISQFRGQPWSSWIVNLDMNALANTAEKLHNDCRVTRLPRQDMGLFGICPENDRFCAVICSTCGAVVKPQGLQRHLEIKHTSDSESALLPPPQVPVKRNKTVNIKLKNKDPISSTNALTMLHSSNSDCSTTVVPTCFVSVTASVPLTTTTTTTFIKNFTSIAASSKITSANVNSSNSTSEIDSSASHTNSNGSNNNNSNCNNNNNTSNSHTTRRKSPNMSVDRKTQKIQKDKDKEYELDKNLISDDMNIKNTTNTTSSSRQGSNISSKHLSSPRRTLTGRTKDFNKLVAEHRATKEPPNTITNTNVTVNTTQNTNLISSSSKSRPQSILKTAIATIDTLDSGFSSPNSSQSSQSMNLQDTSPATFSISTTSPSHLPMSCSPSSPMRSHHTHPHTFGHGSTPTTTTITTTTSCSNLIDTVSAITTVSGGGGGGGGSSSSSSSSGSDSSIVTCSANISISSTNSSLITMDLDNSSPTTQISVPASTTTSTTTQPQTPQIIDTSIILPNPAVKSSALSLLSSPISSSSSSSLSSSSSSSSSSSASSSSSSSPSSSQVQVVPVTHSQTSPAQIYTVKLPDSPLIILNNNNVKEQQQQQQNSCEAVTTITTVTESSATTTTSVVVPLLPAASSVNLNVNTESVSVSVAVPVVPVTLPPLPPPSPTSPKPIVVSREIIQSLNVPVVMEMPKLSADFTLYASYPKPLVVSTFSAKKLGTTVVFSNRRLDFIRNQFKSVLKKSRRFNNVMNTPIRNTHHHHHHHHHHHNAMTTTTTTTTTTFGLVGIKTLTSSGGPTGTTTSGISNNNSRFAKSTSANLTGISATSLLAHRPNILRTTTPKQTRDQQHHKILGMGMSTGTGLKRPASSSPQLTGLDCKHMLLKPSGVGASANNINVSGIIGKMIVHQHDVTETETSSSANHLGLDTVVPVNIQ